MVENRFTKIFLPAVCLVLAAAGATFFWFSNAGLKDSPDISFQLIDGRKIELGELTGRPVVITFWATTCRTCVAKTPELKALYRKFQPEGLELIAVAMSYDPPNRILAFSDNNSIPYPIALDLDGTAARAFDNVTLTPTTFLIDSDGKIVFSKAGNINIQNLDEKIFTLLSGDKTGTDMQAT